MPASDELRDFLVGFQGPQEAAEAPVRNNPTPTTSRFVRAIRKLFSANTHNWQPGQPGKGFFDSKGNLHSWVVNDYYEPNHGEWAGDHGVDDYTAPYLYINPDGRVENYGVFQPEHHANLERLWQLDPRLKPAEDEW
jgi:hypothetical protein